LKTGLEAGYYVGSLNDVSPNDDSPKYWLG
jgi:hypothetical protein